MELNKIRIYRRRLRMTSGVLKDNPVLALGLALPFAIIPSLTLKSGLAMSWIIAMATILPAVLAAMLGSGIPEFLRAPVYVTLSMIGVLLSLTILSHWPMVIDGLGIYIPLAAVNTLMIELTLVHPREQWRCALFDALKMCLGFALVVCGVSALREILGNRTLWDYPLGIYPIKMYGVTLPFFGFILLGFLSALFRSIDRVTVRKLLGGNPSAAGGTHHDE